MDSVLLVHTYVSVQALPRPNMVPGYRQKIMHAQRIGFGARSGRFHDDIPFEALLNWWGGVLLVHTLGPYRHHQVLNTSSAKLQVQESMRARLALEQASAGCMTTVLRHFMTWLVGWCAVGPYIGSVQASSSSQHESGRGV